MISVITTFHLQNLVSYIPFHCLCLLAHRKKGIDLSKIITELQKVVKRFDVLPFGCHVDMTPVRDTHKILSFSASACQREFVST